VSEAQQLERLYHTAWRYVSVKGHPLGRERRHHRATGAHQRTRPREIVFREAYGRRTRDVTGAAIYTPVGNDGSRTVGISHRLDPATAYTAVATAAVVFNHTKRGYIMIHKKIWTFSNDYAKIILFLQHYKSFSLAKEKWLQRKKGFN